MWGALAGLASSGAQFGMNYGAALLDAKIQRDLRRTVYQDQMHSMRQAGLNPILAAGATPGMGTSGTMQSADLSNAVDSAMRAKKNPDERRLLEAQADKAEAEAATADDIREATRRELENRGSLHRSNIEANAPGGWRARLADSQAEAARAAAGLSSARETGQIYDNKARGIQAEYLESGPGRGLRLFRHGAEDLGAVAGAAMRIPRFGGNPSRRETATNARTRSTSRPVPPLERGRTRSGNRSGSWLKEEDGTWSRVDLRTGEVFESGLKSPGHYGPD